MMNRLLPIGSVVLIGNAEKRVMIVGVCQRSANDDKLWDYVGVVFPEGYLSGERMIMFNHESITRLYFVGLQDMEQLEFGDKLEEFLEESNNK